MLRYGCNFFCSSGTIVVTASNINGCCNNTIAIIPAKCFYFRYFVSRLIWTKVNFKNILSGTFSRTNNDVDIYVHSIGV